MRTLIVVGLFVVSTIASGCGPSPRTNGTPDALTTTCVGGGQRCVGNSLETCQGDVWTHVTDCPMACNDTLGCVVCNPGTGTCTANMSHECRSDGSGFQDVFCDPEQGMSCGPAGTCVGECSPLSLGETYFGCDYYPTVTGNIVAGFYDYAVAVANTAGTEARVTIDAGGLGAPDVFMVPAGSVVVRLLPWVAALKMCSTTGMTYFDCYNVQTNGALAVRGAYHLRSNVPVTVYQFNALQYFKPGSSENSYTNDASLLFPTNAWRNDHFVVAWQNTAGIHPSLMAVTAAQANTVVTVNVSSSTAAAGGAPAFTAGTPQTITLNAGDVLELATISGDLTGSRVTSDKPVQVIGGHFCANVPDGFGYCDHLEEVMLPIDALGATYVVNAPAVVTSPSGKEEMVRIVAVEGPTALVYDPPVAGAPTTIPALGGWIEISRQVQNFQVTADHKILVAQYNEGSSVSFDNTGDPDITLAVPVEQFRTEYLFHAPTNYTTNYVNITMPMAAVVTLDGAPVPAPIAIGASGWGVSRVTPLNNGPANDGNHYIMGSAAFGISVYGYGMDTSYWYMGGLDLGRIIIE